MTTALETIDLSKRYRRSWALQNCSLTIPAGRIAALIGPNGAGKTTLINLIVGLLRPTSGSVRMFGSKPEDAPASLARLGFVAQDRPLYRGFTVDETLRFGARLNPGWDDEMARRHLTRLNIPFGQRVGKLSGGQQSQVALILALAKRPDLIVLDEPVAALDPLARREFLQLLIDATIETGLTVLLSSHLVGELERVCDYVVILNNSQVQFSGGLDAFVSGHRVLVRSGPVPDHSLTGFDIIQHSHFNRETRLLVRADGRSHDPDWDVREPGFEEIVLAYLGCSDTRKEATR